MAAACVPAASAQVYVQEYGSYVDANGIYTIMGSVRNAGEWAASGFLIISIQEQNHTHSETFGYLPVPADSEMPFKAKMPGVPPEAILLEPHITYAQVPAMPPGIRVVYDHTLVLHPDGHLTGYVLNAGNRTIHNPSIWAVIHGDAGVLDVARNHDSIGPLEPGDMAQFTMYPDPSVSEMVTYYSCFAPSDNSVFRLPADRNGQEYPFRYESGAWLYRPQFNPEGTQVTIQTTNSYPFETFANLEIPPVTREESFVVYRNGEETDYIQSMDEMGMWHVAFDIRERSQDIITVSGFEPGPVLPLMVPTYVREHAAEWGAGQASGYDSLLEDMRLMADRGMIPGGVPGEPHIPQWASNVMEWYGSGAISDHTLLAMLSNMLERGIIRLG